MTLDEIKTLAETLQSLRPGAEFAVDAAGVRWFDQHQTQPTEAEISAFVPPAPAPNILSQDLMAQFTAADAAKIQAAVAANPQFWLLWSSLQAQKDPMEVGNARFSAGWSALVSVLGADRMTAIGTALGVTV